MFREMYIRAQHKNMADSSQNKGREIIVAVVLSMYSMPQEFEAAELCEPDSRSLSV